MIKRADTAGQHVRLLSVGGGMLALMSRHSTFKFCLDPTVEHQVLARHVGAARFAFNQCLRMTKTALTQRKSDPRVEVPWTGFDLINALNGWKKTRWYPSSKLCPACGAIRGDLMLADRVFTCSCGHSADRDLNAPVNLARWAQAHHDPTLDPRTPKHGGRATNARRRDGADQHPSSAGETSPVEAGTDVHAAPAA